MQKLLITIRRSSSFDEISPRGHRNFRFDSAKVRGYHNENSLRIFIEFSQEKGTVNSKVPAFISFARYCIHVSIEIASVKNDAGSMFDSPRVRYGSNFSKLHAHDEPRNLGSKRQ